MVSMIPSALDKSASLERSLYAAAAAAEQLAAAARAHRAQVLPEDERV